MTSGLPTFRSYLQSLGQLVVQPRMGFSRPDEMRAGMIATATCGPRTVATITIDSYSRVNDRGRAAEAVRQDLPLNGYPIIVHPAEVTRELVGAVGALGVPVQVRHGSALALPIVESLVMAGITATEGGPVSYTLPYSRVRLNAAVEDWRRSCSCLAESSPDAHLESFGGCMLGQLCPPSMLVAISVLESLFFVQQGLRSVSLSYAQQTNRDQDLEALHALRRFASELLPDTDWHIVLYAYMGVYPKSYQGGFDLIG
jgi:nikkomycin biosynthsis protein sanV